MGHDERVVTMIWRHLCLFFFLSLSLKFFHQARKMNAPFLSPSFSLRLTFRGESYSMACVSLCASNGPCLCLYNAGLRIDPFSLSLYFLTTLITLSRFYSLSSLIPPLVEENNLSPLARK